MGEKIGHPQPDKKNKLLTDIKNTGGTIVDFAMLSGVLTLAATGLVLKHREEKKKSKILKNPFKQGEKENKVDPETQAARKKIAELAMKTELNAAEIAQMAELQKILGIVDGK